MRKILSLVLLIGLISCKKQEISRESFDNGSVQLRTTLPSVVSQYLDSFYNDTYKVGESEYTTADSKTFEVVEIIVEGDTRARGYVVFDSITNDFVYHADVDRVNYILLLQTIGEANPVVIQNIDQINDYTLTNDYDFVQAIIDLDNGGDIDDLDQTARKFWGSTILNDDQPCIGGVTQVLYQDWAFWLKNGTHWEEKPC